MSLWARAVRVGTPEAFEGAVQAASRQKRVFVLFTGAKDKATGESWCGDCVRAVPRLTEALEREKEGELVVVEVERAAYRGNPDYPLRRHKGVRLTTVPTFGRWENGRLEMRLENDQIADPALLEDVLAQ
jgi:thiol-disulfide isomerase/thioredoxin